MQLIVLINILGLYVYFAKGNQRHQLENQLYNAEVINSQEFNDELYNDELYNDELYNDELYNEDYKNLPSNYPGGRLQLNYDETEDFDDQRNIIESLQNQYGEDSDYEDDYNGDGFYDDADDDVYADEYVYNDDDVVGKENNKKFDKPSNYHYQDLEHNYNDNDSYDDNGNEYRDGTEDEIKIDESSPKVKEDQFPFMVSLTQNGVHFCAGSIITPMFILTSAYCCFDNSGQLLHVEDLRISVGSLDWKKGKMYSVANIYVHHSYNSVDFQSNVGLLQLQDPIMPTHNARAVILNHHYVDEEVGTIRAMIIGWGTITPEGKFASRGSDELTKTTLLSIAAGKCVTVYKRIYAEEFCMVSKDHQQTDSCSGDPGGPLIAMAGDKPVQIGLLSYGTDCANNAPEVFTRISMYYPWIRAMLDKVRQNTYLDN